MLPLDYKYKNIISNLNNNNCTWSFINYEQKTEGTFLKFIVDKSSYTREYYWLQKYGNLNIPFDVDPIPDPKDRINKIVGYWEIISPWKYNKNGIIRSSNNWKIGKEIPEIFNELFKEEKDHITIFIT